VGSEWWITKPPLNQKRVIREKNAMAVNGGWEWMEERGLGSHREVGQRKNSVASQKRTNYLFFGPAHVPATPRVTALSGHG
jgi:hypothetical protein